jgi:hypothetical protein
MDDKALEVLTNYLAQVPAIGDSMGRGYHSDGLWWVKFRIDIQHRLAWQVVQEIGHVANYLSVDERLPTVFYPASPPPYMNGGPEEFLSWVIENSDKNFTPSDMKEWLEGRLPRPVSDETEWPTDSDENE